MVRRSLLALLLLALTLSVPVQAARPAAASPDGQASSLDWPGRPPTPHVQVTYRVLAIPWYHQAHALSCEAAALRMALSFLGVHTDELALMAYMGYDERPAVLDRTGHLARWGDPNAAYVGNPDGNIFRYTGYGVYFAPVARAASAAGAGVLAAGGGLYGTAISPKAVYDAVLKGHPVVVWISNTYHRSPLSSYVAYDGSRVYYTLTEHAVTIAGVRPDAVLINDPWFGPHWHSRAQFESAYSTFGQMAVILGR